MKQKIKNYSLRFIKDLIPVIAGILIALYINNWNDSLKDKKYIDQVSSTIYSELEETHLEVSENKVMQEALIDSLELYANKTQVNVLDVVLKTKGINLPKIKMNAWKSVSYSKIDLIDYKKVTTLSDIEEQKNILEKKGDNLLNFLYLNFYEVEKNKKETLKIILMDILQTETTIQQLIEKFQDHYSIENN